MSMSSGFFEANIDDSGEYDRVYHAEEFAHYFSQFIGNGVFGNPTNQLKIESLDNRSMEVVMKTGNAYINGYWFYSSENETIKLTNASGVMPRYDAIVLRYSALNRKITLEVKEGSYAENPRKPTIEQNDDIYELCLAYVYVAQNATEIIAANIEDTRPNEDICGFVIALVQQLETKDLFEQYTSAYNVWFDSIKNEANYDMEDFNRKFLLWFDTIKGHLTEDTATVMNARIDELEMRVDGFINRVITFNEDGSITEAYEGGRIKITTFNEDNTVTEKVLDRGITIWEKTTTFLENGITEESVKKGDFV